jgi:acyl-CoA thioester hydrolase
MTFKLELEVRDYECDAQGIVNNAVYQNYLEHARHVFLKQTGIDFIALSKRGINLVVVRAELDYLYPLHYDDHFSVSVAMEKISRLRVCCHQSIHRLPDEKPILQAKIIWTSISESGRPYFPKELDEMVEKIIQA